MGARAHQRWFVTIVEGVLFAETAAWQLRDIAAPIGRQKSARDVAVKRTMRPIASARHQPMFHRIEVDVIDVTRKVGLVADDGLPIAALPNSLLTPSDLAPAPWRILRQAAGEIMFDQAPAPGKISVVRWQGPNSVHVIGENADRDGLEWIALQARRIGTAKPLDVPHQE